MKAQIRAKMRNWRRGWAEYRRPDVKNGVQGPSRGDGWRCSNTREQAGGGQGRGGRRQPGQRRPAAAGAGEGDGRSRGGRQWLDLFGEDMEKKRKKMKFAKITQKNSILSLSEIVLSQLKTRISAYCNELLQNW
jgi:hypothetical protein